MKGVQCDTWGSFRERGCVGVQAGRQAGLQGWQGNRTGTVLEETSVCVNVCVVICACHI